MGPFIEHCREQLHCIRNERKRTMRGLGEKIRSGLFSSSRALQNRLTEANVNGLLHKYFKPWKFTSNFLKWACFIFPSVPYQNRKGILNCFLKKQYKHVNRVALVVLLAKQKALHDDSTCYSLHTLFPEQK